jgi:VanZ family protein
MAFKGNDLHWVIDLKEVSSYFQHVTVRWMLTLTWTAIDMILMLSPGSKGSVAGETSGLFGGTDITDAIGHVILKAILVLLWCWMLSHYTSLENFIRWVAIGGLTWAVVAELAQFFVPDRGVSVLDLAANILGVLIGLKIYYLGLVWVNGDRNYIMRLRG